MTLESNIRLPRPGVLRRFFTGRFEKTSPYVGTWVEEVLAYYGLRLRKPMKTLPGAVRNETWTVHTAAGKQVLKRYKRSTQYDQIVHEHSILQKLKESGFPAPRLYEGELRQTIVTCDGDHYALFGFLEGYFHFFDYIFLPDRHRWYYKEMGRTLAALHAALAGFTPAGRNLSGFSAVDGLRARSRDWWMDIQRSNREKMRAAAPEAEEDALNRRMLEQSGWLEDLFSEVDEEINAAHLPHMVIHGDYGPHNLLVKPGRPMVVLDFELARLDWRLVDLTAALSTTTTRPGRLNFMEIMQHIVDGYQSQAPIPPDEFHLLPQVWQYQVIRMLFYYWGLYLDHKDPAVRKRIGKHLNRLAWVRDHQQELRALGTGRFAKYQSP